MAFLSAGCDEEGNSEFVFWLAPDEVVDESRDNAFRVQTRVQHLGYLRNVVEGRRPARANKPLRWPSTRCGLWHWDLL